MEMTTVLLIVVLVVVVLQMFLNKKPIHDSSQNELSERVDRLNKQMVDTMMTMQQILDKRLEESSKLMHDQIRTSSEHQLKGSKHIGDRMDNAAKAMSAVMERLAKVEEANKRIYDVGKDIASLQEILKAPKLRGNLGELFLGDLLGQIFPADHFTLQHRFKDGQAVDAVIKLKDELLVPVDSKFPLENFVNMVNFQKEQDIENANRERKLFITQVKKHIDDISNKYIRTDEGTLDFALMYIPAENVYYETIMKDDGGLVAYAHQKKVFPVSPNSFYIYLQAILMGLQGLQIEKETKNIIANIGRMQKEFSKFSDDFRLIGTHLGRAKSSFDNSEKRLEKFSDKMNHLTEQTSSESQTQLLE